MKLSENWLRSWVNPTLSAQEIGEQLTMAGLELDDLTKVAKDFSHVVVGEVLEVTQHPDADKLKVTKVNVGTHSTEPLQIVCGASNVAVGVRVPVALVGAELPPIDGKPFHIKKGKLRGVESQGMLCGGSEIDLDDGVDGLLILPNDAPIGANLREYLALDNHILDISITPNRGDCFSVRGIARELAVINKMPFALPFEPVVSEIVSNTSQSVKVESTDCPRYLAQVVENLSAKTQSPDWLKKSLTASGIRPRNLLVDVTNYILMELGQPLHAFDADKIVGSIIVRQAKVGESFELLNEQTVTLKGDELVIADEQGVIALAGIMGGMRTAVTDDTTKVVIESAFFKPLAIAGKARRFGLHTDASQRFERGVDFDLPKIALDRAVNLLQTLGNGTVGQQTFVENFDELPKRETVSISLSKIEQLLGVKIDNDEILDILNRLEINAKIDNDTLIATPPSHRFDIAIGEDLVEEIARIYGYNNIANQLPSFSANLFDNATQNKLHDIKMTLVNQGYFEAISFSFSDEKIEKLFATGEILALANPISQDLAVMRSTLLSSLLPCVQHNLNRQQTRVRLFETGLRFLGSEIANLQQLETLTLVATGLANPEQPNDNRAMDFYDLKHDVESLIPRHILESGQIRYERSGLSFLHTGQSADIIWQNGDNEQIIGFLGQLHPKIAKALDLGTVWVAEFDLDKILAMYAQDKKITSPSKFPQVRRDFAFLVDKSMAWGEIETAVRQVAGDKLTACTLFDVYQSEKLGDKKSLAFGLIWQDETGTLDDASIKDLSDKVIACVVAMGGVLRDA